VEKGNSKEVLFEIERDGRMTTFRIHTSVSLEESKNQIIETIKKKKGGEGISRLHCI